jgi:hypothetical protein
MHVVTILMSAYFVDIKNDSVLTVDICILYGI